LLQHQNPDPPNLLESNITIREDKMKKTAFTEEQIAYALRQAETGTPVADICRKLGVSEQTFYRWKKKFAGMGIAELRRLRQLEEENRTLKQLVADLTLDKHMLQEAIRKKL
jgi:putative transposase